MAIVFYHPTGTSMHFEERMKLDSSCEDNEKLKQWVLHASVVGAADLAHYFVKCRIYSAIVDTDKVTFTQQYIIS